MTESTHKPVSSVARKFKWIALAPLVAFIALTAWAFASPVGASPDDDYHLVSIWCANGGSPECQPGSDSTHRLVDSTFNSVICYAQKPKESAECQLGSNNSGTSYETDRGNFTGEYPPLYYSAMRLLAGNDIVVSAIVMRLVNAAIFVGLTTALFLLLPINRRQTLIWGWLISVIPLGIFLIPSNNPSSWAFTGVGTAFLALLGWFESEGKRRIALGVLYLVGVFMAAGSRGDAAVYVAGASLTVMIFEFVRTKKWILASLLPAAGIVVSAAFMLSASQAGVAAIGFTASDPGSPSAPGDAGPATAPVGLALAAYNLLSLPFLWTGVWGTWALGWFDTGLPAIVPWAAVSAFVVVGFAGIGRLNWRKSIGLAGVLLVLIVLPVYVLTVGGMQVGQTLQPRYLLPLILLFSMLLVTIPKGMSLSFTRVQTFVIFSALSVANLVSLQVNIRRYLTGSDSQGFNLDAGAEWWWPGFPIGPIWVWLVGAIAFIGLLSLLWPQIRSLQLRDQALVPNSEKLLASGK